MAVGAGRVRSFDSLGCGVWLGVVAPLVVLGIMGWSIYVRMEWVDCLRFLLQEGTLGRMVSLATLPDAVLFFVAIYTHRLRAARGLLGSTIVYAMLAMGLAIAM